MPAAPPPAAAASSAESEPRPTPGPSLAVALTVSLPGTGSGLVTSSPAGLSCGGTAISCTGWFAEHATVTLTATPEAGSTFDGWTGACTGTGTCEVSAVGTPDVTATFSGPATITYYHLDAMARCAQSRTRSGTSSPATTTSRSAKARQLSGDPWRFTGKQRDPETAFDYFEARYRRNVWGRFTTVDPLMEQWSAISRIPQQWNRYTYAKQNPLRYVDPTGQSVKVVDERAYQVHSGTLDEELRKFVVLKDMFINKEIMKKAKTDDPTFLALLDLVTDERKIRVSTGDRAEFFKNDDAKTVYALQLKDDGSGRDCGYRGAFLEPAKHSNTFDSGLVRSRSGDARRWLCLV